MPDEEAPSSPSQEELDYLGAWLQAQPFEVEPAAPTMAMLVAYQNGMLGTEDIRNVQRGLVRSREARGLLRETRDALVLLRALPWHEVAKRASDEDTVGRVARIWVEMVSRRAHNATNVRRLWNASGPSAIRRLMAEGVEEAQTAWASFVALGDQLRTGLRMSGQMVSAVRGGSTGGFSTIIGAPDYIIVQPKTEIDSNGTLHSSTQLMDEQGRPVTSLDGQTVHLSLIFSGSAWSVASAAVAGSQLKFEAADVGDVLALATGPISQEYVRLSLGDGVLEADVNSRVLLAEVLDRRSQPTGQVAVAIELAELPQTEQGVLPVLLEFKVEYQRLAYLTHELLLEFGVTADRWQLLDRWPISELSDEPRTVLIAWPDAREAFSLLTVPLRARIRPLS